MRISTRSVVIVAAVLVAAAGAKAQAPDGARVVAGGGVFVQGWTGRIDANEERSGRVMNDSKLAQEGNGLRVTTGPAITYWNPKNVASGAYTVKATFTEPNS